MSLFGRGSDAGTAQLPVEGHFPGFDGATEWINSEPLTAAGLRGRVVVVDFCTYTCINWLRSLPYVRAWSQLYEDRRLVVVGVHTPEFSFEKNLENVRRALKAMRVEFPIAVDNDYSIWEAFSNHYWPALYFIDTEGRIRHHRFGEGDYEQSEIVIQQLVTEAGLDSLDRELVSVDPEGPEVAADWDSLESPENYLGYQRTQNFASPGGLVRGEARMYSAPERVRRNHWALSGTWTAGSEAIAMSEPNGRIACQFHARDVHLVMGPAAGDPVRFRAFLDGRAPGAEAGSDVDAEGAGLLDQQRMYQLIRQQGRIDDRLFEIEFLDRGAEAFAFTFG